MSFTYKEKINNKKNIHIWRTLILHNCLPISRQAKFTSKNVTQYLLGSRNDFDLFKFNEIKHLLLKFTPLLETLFHSKLILKNKFGGHIKKFIVKLKPPRDPAKLDEWKIRTKGLKIQKTNSFYYYKTLEKNQPIKILFATINPLYSNLIESSATLCNMSFHKNRWLCGYLSANSNYLKKDSDKKKGQATTSESIQYYFQNSFSENKESLEKRYEWHNLYKISNRPTLLIVPDIQNNPMILREVPSKNIPVIGLVNSDCSTKIAYPIFGNADSIQIVHFFCNFLAVLIAKTFVQQEYKQISHRLFTKTRWQLKHQFFKMRIKKNPQLKYLQTRRVKQLLKLNKKIFWRRRSKERLQQILHNRKKNITVNLSLTKRRAYWRDYRILTKLARTNKKQKALMNHRLRKNFWLTHIAWSVRKRFKKKEGHSAFFKNNLNYLYIFRVQSLRWKKKQATQKQYKPNKFITKLRKRLQYNEGNLPFMSLIPLFTRVFTTKNKKLFHLFLKKNPNLTHFIMLYLDTIPKLLTKDISLTLFSERNNKINLPYSFSLTRLNKQNLISHEMLWENNFWNTFITKKRKRKLRNYVRYRYRQKEKYRGKLRKVRINKPYNFRSTINLWMKFNMKRLTLLLKKSTINLFWYNQRADLKKTRFFHKKLRRTFFKLFKLYQIIPNIKTTHKLLNKPKTKRWNRRYVTYKIRKKRQARKKIWIAARSHQKSQIFFPAKFQNEILKKKINLKVNTKEVYRNSKGKNSEVKTTQQKYEDKTKVQGYQDYRVLNAQRNKDNTKEINKDKNKNKQKKK